MACRWTVPLNRRVVFKRQQNLLYGASIALVNVDLVAPIFFFSALWSLNSSHLP